MLSPRALCFLGGFELRLRSILEVVDTGFRLYRRHFLYLVGLAAIPNMLLAPLFLLLGRYWTPAWWVAEEDFLAVFISQILGGIGALWIGGVQLVLTLLLGAAGMHSLAMGEKPTILGAVRKVLARWRAAAAATAMHATLLAALACLSCGVPLLSAVYGTFFALFAHVMFFEGAGLGVSLRRSARLAGHYFFTVLVVLLITYGGFSKVVEYGVTIPITVGGLMRHGFMGGEGQVFYALLGAGKGLAQALAWPLVTATLSVLYYDLLLRREGLDLRLRCLRIPVDGVRGRAPVQAREAI
jgi:hypothetical protein